MPSQLPQPWAGQPGFPHAYAGQNLRNNIDLFNELTNKGLPVVHVFPFKMACFSYLLFDIEEFFVDEKNTKTELMLKIKNIGNGKFQPMYTTDNCGVKRWEEMHVFDHTTVAANVAASATVNVTDATRLKGIGANTKIRFQTTTAPFTATNPWTKLWVVASIAGNVITLVDPITLTAGDKVYRGSNLRQRCGKIENKYDRNKRAEYITYFQSIQANIDFETCDLSADRLVYAVDGSNPQSLINLDVNNTFEGILKNDFLDVFLYAENQPQAGTDASQTMGLITTLQDAQVSNGKGYIMDLNGLMGTDSDEDTIAVLIEYFIKAFESGFYSNEPLSVIINNAQMKHLMFMAPEFEEFFGIQFYRENPSSHAWCRDYVSLRVHGIEIEHGTVEFILFEPLTAYFEDTPIMMIMPRNMMGLYSRKNPTVDSNLKIKETFDNGMFPKFTFKDISMFKYYESGGDECMSFVTKLEFALAWAGIFNDAYYVLKNAKSHRQPGASMGATTSMVVAS